MENFSRGTKTFSKAIGAISLITGTSVGGGILALPVVTSPYGFAPSIFLFIVTWLAMTFTAFLLLECSLSMKNNSNLISLSRSTLGRPGECIAWSSYLLLLYSLLAAYISGSSSLLNHAYAFLTHHSPSTVVTSIALTFAFMYLVSYGIRIVDKLNRVFIMIGGLCYFILLFLLSSHLQIGQLVPANPSKMAASLPVLVTAFGFHIVLPSLVRYLNRDVKLLRICLFIGSLIPLVLYIAWQLAILGSIPSHGEHSMQAIMSSPDQLASLIDAVTYVTGSKIISTILYIFCGMSILTSLLGVSLSLWDFLVDGLPQSKWIGNKVSLSILTFGPPVWLVMFFPGAFSSLLGYAGIFVSILLGLLPIAMCWRGRSKCDWPSKARAPGGRIVMLLASLFFAYTIIEQLFAQ